MGGSESKQNRPKSSSQNASLPIENIGNVPKDHVLHRLVVDLSGSIGSFYDARNDQLLNTKVVGMPCNMCPPSDMKQYPKIECGKLEEKSSRDILRIDKDLALSLYLNLVESNSISSFIRYSCNINKSTRYFSYYDITKISEAEVRQTYEFQKMKAFIGKNDPTHVVSKIVSGIHLIIIFQLSSETEDIFEQLVKNLKIPQNENTIELLLRNESLLNRFNNIKVFSNVPHIAPFTNFADICREITKMKAKPEELPPIQYLLHPIRAFCPSYPTQKGLFFTYNTDDVNQTEEYLYELLSVRDRSKVLPHSELMSTINTHLRKVYTDLKEQNSKLEKHYYKFKHELKEIISKYRSEGAESDSLTNIIKDEGQSLLQQMKHTVEQIDALSEKANVIKDLLQQKIHYINVKERFQEYNLDLVTIIKQLQFTNEQKVIYCFDDKLDKLRSKNWNKLFRQMINHRKSNPQLEIVYADFSYSEFKLPEIKIFNEKDILQGETIPPVTTISPKPPQDKRRNKSPVPSNKFVNILFLGESGVGKSTFINAIANYYEFDTLEKASKSEPVAVMPVSFLMTVGHNFEEKIVRFGKTDPNEDFNHPGQSVTQKCRSYVFTLSTRTKLRIIDTPGMGDTRGPDQDELNMQHILSFINKLPHLNAICILLKPNESKLNIVIHLYLTRLLGFLGKAFHRNIIFCFTNSRSTFYAPGDTGPQLKSILKAKTFNDIPFEKMNSFCFDNESFRYLMALKNEIEFDDFQKREYNQSWLISVKETNRLIEYICQTLKECPQEKWMSIEHAQYQINRIIFPMFDTMANIKRNKIAIDGNMNKSLINLSVKLVNGKPMICMKCDRTVIRCGEFGFIWYKLHRNSTPCDICQGNRSKNPRNSYILEYNTLDDALKLSKEVMGENLADLTDIIGKFIVFYKHMVQISKENDRMLLVLEQLIEEEEYILSQKGDNILNRRLYDELKDFKEKYEKYWSRLKPEDESIDLGKIYELIGRATEIKDIEKQLWIIKRGDEVYMKENEKNCSRF